MGVGALPASRFRRSAVAAALSLALLAAGCTRPPPDPDLDPIAGPTPGPTPAAATVLRIGIGPVAGIDPGELETPDAVLVAGQVFEGLVAYEPDTGDLLPAAAERWDVEDEGRRFVFHLGEGRFHDGTPVTAQDFVRSWTRLIDPTVPRPYAFLLESVQGFVQHRLSFGARPFRGLRAIDDRTLAVRLNEPWPEFPAVLGHPALAPVPEGADDPEFVTQPVGNGPYRVADDLGLAAPIRLVTAEGADTGADAIEFRQYDRAEEAWPEFLGGQLDVSPIPPALVQDARTEFGEEGLQVLPRLVYCGFNMERPFPQELRTAVSVALDRSPLVEGAYGALAEPADGIVPPTLEGHRPGACGDDCEHDPERAADLLADLLADLPPRIATFPLDYARSEVGEALAEGIVEQLREAGLRPRPRAHDPDEYAELLREGDHGFFCLVWSADYPRPQAMLDPLLRADSADNRTGIDDRRLERILARARAEADPAAREEAYAAAEARALELMPIVPVAWLRSSLAAQPHVAGFRLDPLGSFDAAALVIEE